MVDHYATKCRQIMNYLKGLKLIGNMLCRAEICHKLEALSQLSWYFVKVQIEWNATGAAIDVDARIIKSKPLPNISGERCSAVKMFHVSVKNNRCSRLR